MAGERTPLFHTTPRSTKRSSIAKIAACVSLAGAIGAVLYMARNDPIGSLGSTPFPSLSLGASITDDNWFCGETKFEANYIKLTNKKSDDEYFYWFVPSRSDDPTKDPLVLWLTGGPGASSMLAMFTENGPCIVEANLTTRWNQYSWTNKANVIWLDQPSGVGFSVFNDTRDADENEADVGANVYAFLNGFLDKHPEFVGHDFYVTGESYGGHYVPGASHYIWEQNKKVVHKRINLQGIAIGNGITNPNIQYKHHQDMAQNAYNMTVLTDKEVAQMKKDSEMCVALVEECQKASQLATACRDAADCWADKLTAPFMKANRNLYDIRQPCSPDKPESCGFDGSFLNDYFALDVVQKHLAVKCAWHESDEDVKERFLFSGDSSFAYHTYVADLLNDGLRVLIYAGDADLMCNWIGNRAWTLDLAWKGKEGYNAAEERAFKTQDPYVKDAPVKDAGVVRQFDNFAFVRVFEAGHMVPTNQPAVAWVLLDKFLNGQHL